MSERKDLNIMPHQNHLFIFGCGFTGTRVAIELLSRGGWKVSGCVRTALTAQKLQAMGIEAVVYDASVESEALYAERKEDVARLLRTATHVLDSAPPTAHNGDELLHTFKNNLLKDSPYLEWLGYLSTTGVYGNWNGETVDETTLCKPISRRGKLRAEAENAMLTSGLPVNIFRLPGIYGPNRGTLVKIRSGTQKRIRKKGHCFSRIHVDDIVGAVLASALKPVPGRVYNVVDDFPCPQHEIVEYGCNLLGVEVPPLIEFEDAELSAMARSFYGENKRVSNIRLKTELLPTLKYPTYKEGMVAQLLEETAEASKKKPVNKRSSYSSSITSSHTYGLLSRLPVVGSIVASLIPKTKRVCTVVVDNGSLRASSTVNLRKICAMLQSHLGVDVMPVSCRFSNRIPQEELDNVNAELLEPCLFRLVEEGYDSVVIIPLFFGPSSTVTNFIPSKVMNVRKQYPQLKVHVASTLVAEDKNVPIDERLVDIFVKRVKTTAKAKGISKPKVVVVDHGTPVRLVNECRVRMTEAVEKSLGKFAERVVGASMERREGEEYAYNEPLLETTLFEMDGFGTGDVIIAMMFLQPGRHAGSGGDVETILKDQEKKHPGLQTHVTDLIGTGDEIIPILADRFLECLEE
eukprot:CFRG4133T1